MPIHKILSTQPQQNIIHSPTTQCVYCMVWDIQKIHSVPAAVELSSSWNINFLFSGIIMSFTWLVLASCGILLARYYKGAWPNSTLCGKPVWFQVNQHRKSRVATMPKLSTLLISEIAIVITYGASSEDKIGIITILGFSEVGIPLGCEVLTTFNRLSVTRLWN